MYKVGLNDVIQNVTCIKNEVPNAFAHVALARNLRKFASKFLYNGACVDEQYDVNTYLL